jgi:hypothetical protein
VLPSIGGLRYILSESQHNQLVGGRYVTFDQKVAFTSSGLATRFTVKDGVTAASSGTDYTRLSTLRIVHETVQMIRRVSDPFIGKPSGMAQKNALAAEIQSGLDGFKEAGKLSRFSFEIYSPVSQKVLGNSFITLILVPEYETRKFYTSVALRQA